MAVSPVELRGEPSCIQLPQLLKDSKVWISETCPTVGQKRHYRATAGALWINSGPHGKDALFHGTQKG
jgi:hypothetical protein